MSEVFMNIAGTQAEEPNRLGAWMRVLLPVLLTSSWLSLAEAQSRQDLERLQSEQDVQSSQPRQRETDDGDSRWRMPPSLKEAIDQALARRLDVRLSQIDARQAEARTHQAQSKFHPRLELAAEFRNTHQWDRYSGTKASFDLPGTGPVNINVENETSRYQLLPRIEATYNLYSGGADKASVRHARILTDAAGLGMEMASQQAILDVARRYLDLRKQCMVSESAHADMRAASLKFDIMTRRHSLGRLSDIELQEAELERLEKQQTQFNRFQQVKSAYGRYAIAVTDHPRSVHEATSACHFTGRLQDEIDQLGKLAIETPGLKKAALDEAAAREQLVIEKASTRPQVSLFAQYNFVSRRDDLPRRLVGDTTRQDAMFGLRVSYNLYDGRLADARQQESLIALQRQQFRREQQAARLNAFRHQQRLRQEELMQAIDMAQAKLDLAKSRRVLAEKRFKLGRVSTLQLAEVRGSEDKARHELDIAEIDRIRAHVESLYAEAASSAEGNAPAQ